MQTTAEESSSSATPSEDVVSNIMHQGLQDMVLYGGAGLVLGGVAGVVLSRTPNGRKILAGLGSGAGLGHAWTQTSIRLEEILRPVDSSNTK